MHENQVLDGLRGLGTPEKAGVYMTSGIELL